jgi:hypothetical protein
MKNGEECLAYVEHLRREHRHLGDAMRAINDEMAKQATVTLELVNELKALAAELQHHFREEEEGGCIEEAVSCCPSLSPEAKRLEREHPELRSAVAEVIQRAESGASAEGQAEVRRLFADFSRRLLAHEAAENRILAEAFGYAGDNELERVDTE